ncbi:putative rRNA maturation factor [Sulfuritortus calidifontis]|uniref:Endoribonuclease YbeY n=1 Tax=Sulfuritortus calidifontis TaxID=1914471 RepID=A0A4R3JVU9_9PROT|nr:rRNA maturation RNase YbeY [Sulfuritortus calidifontis]TCS72221.1 putative rRNA maturation factor [Sulfuritortus calidifontis]
MPSAKAANRPARPRLSLAVQFAVGNKTLPTRAELRRWAVAALQRDIQATLRIVGEAEGRALNRDFRGKDYATNVLTFVYGEDPETSTLTGDIVLCAPVVAREAREQKKSLPAHYAHLIVHGFLHLQGYDHEVDRDATVMEALESFIIQSLGYPDPYR